MRTLHIGFNDDGQHFDVAGRQIAEHILKLGRLLFGQFGIAKLTSTVGCNFTGTAFIGHHHELVTGLRNLSQTLNLYWDRWARLFDRLAVFIQHGTNTAKGLTRKNHITRFERSRLN